ncbi:MAG: serine/threonine protein kinase, partial [Actinomadura sp.]
MQAPLRDRDPRRLGPYRLLGRLGRGGMGTVFLGEDGSGRQVAVKVVNAELADDEAFHERFRSEVTAARRVRRFCTAAVLDARLDGEPLYVVTEYVAGPSLERAVREGGPLRGGDLEALAVNIATALTAIHGAGIVHRDLKPSNVLLSPTGPRVIDFGIARALDASDGPTRTGQFIGTPAYMAPELMHGREITPAADVFSWGCVVAYAGTGRAPFGAGTLPETISRVTGGEPDLEGLEPAVRDLVARALAKDPAERPAVKQLIQTLTGEDEPPEDPPAVALPVPAAPAAGPAPDDEAAAPDEPRREPAAAAAEQAAPDQNPPDGPPDQAAPDRHGPGGPDQHAPDQHAPDQHGPDQHGPDQHGSDQHGVEQGGAERDAAAPNPPLPPAGPPPNVPPSPPRTTVDSVPETHPIGAPVPPATPKAPGPAVRRRRPNRAVLGLAAGVVGASAVVGALTLASGDDGADGGRSAGPAAAAAAPFGEDPPKVDDKVFDDDFEDTGSGWKNGAGPSRDAGYGDDEYELRVLPSTTRTVVPAPLTRVPDSQLIEVKVTHGDGGGEAGVYCRGESGGFAFLLRGDGRARIARIDGTALRDVATGTAGDL